MAYQSPNVVDNPLSQLVQQIDFAESEFALFFAQVDSPEQRKQWIGILRQFLESKGIQTIPITFSEPIQDLLAPIRQSLGNRKPLTSACVLVVGLEHSIPSDDSHLPLLSHLNLARELYKNYVNHPIVIWLPEYALTTVARNAPDFWAWRSGVFDFNFATVYLETIQAELDKLNNATKALETLSGILPREQLDALLTSSREKQQKLLAQIRGSGAIAQGEGAIAVGAGGIAIGGSVQGQIHIVQRPKNSQDALTNYCRFVLTRSSRLPLAAIDWVASDPSVRNRPELIDVYIDLDTRTYLEIESQGDVRDIGRREERQERRPFSALESTIRNRQLVLLGEPGAGKSTYLNFLARCLATRFLNIEGKEGILLSEWPEKNTLPILIILREFAQLLPERLDTKPEPRILWDFITKELDAQNLSYVAEPLRQALEQGETLVMFDGLDEVPRERLKLVRDTVIAFTRRYPTNRYLVTSRTLSYSLDRSDLYLPWATFELAPFDAQKIDQFVVGWYTTLGRLGTIRPENETELARRLQSALRRRDLHQLASNPLLLTVMALLNTSQGRLPESRALLYEETADILLWRWDMAKASESDEGPALRQLLMKADRTDVDLKRLLWQLAFEIQAQSGGDYTEMAGDISESRLIKSLAALKNNDYAWAHEIADTIRLRSGLLLERAQGIFSFPSRNLQEYFAGAHLTSQADFVTNCTELLRQDWHIWREVILLATERLVFLVGDTSRPLALVGELCPNTIEHSESYWRNVWLTGDMLLTIGTKRLENYALGRDLIARVRNHLAELLTRGQLSPIERAHAGDTLGKLGDPRPDVSFLPDEPIVGFVEIPAGPFIMGSQLADEAAWDNEKPAHKIFLPAYYIARYPVTVAQFRAFIEDSGYQPANQDSLTGIPNHPVVSVSWYDALAYCEWLTNKLRSRESSLEPLLHKGWVITLPSEAEWEKAARGVDGHMFPWGSAFDSAQANTVETGIGNTTAVGSFPGGASPYGLLDMAGNVWEWTRSSWGRAFQTPDYSYPYKPDDGRENLQASREIYRILRGGSFYENHRFIRTAFRMSSDPGFWKDTIGFRVAVCPIATL